MASPGIRVDGSPDHEYQTMIWPLLRPVHYMRLVSVLGQDGFGYERMEGDHLIYVRCRLSSRTCSAHQA
jgi:hypothetical protein